MKQEKWFDRKFDFGKQVIFPSLLERLEGTPLRLAHKLSSTPASEAIWQPEGKWTIAEQVGHLSDLEPLWQGRLQDMLDGQETMRPTDLANGRTWAANHNEKPLVDLIAEFTALRQQSLVLLSALHEDDIFKSALHPRLLTPMTVQDLWLFVAEHDDHHLALITALKKEVRDKGV